MLLPQAIISRQYSRLRSKHKYPYSPSFPPFNEPTAYGSSEGTT
jgi:hypothetical protein